MSKFIGFPPQVFQYLSELKANNSKEWFEEHRERYELEVRSPAIKFIEAMQAPLLKISEHFLVQPKKMGGSLLRMHRDVRFSSDKSPYKTNVGIQFRHEAGKDVHAPGFYIHIDPEEVFFGLGTWHPAGDALAAIRNAIDKHPLDWKQARDHKAFVKRFTLSGDTLKRAPKHYDIDHPLIEDLKRKDFIAIQPLDPGLVTSPTLVKETTTSFKAGEPFLKFLCNALNVKY